VGVVAVTYFHDTQTTTQSFSQGGTAVFKNIALPVGYLGTPETYLEPGALNITTLVNSATLTLTQSTSQRTNIGNTYTSLILVIKDQATSTVVSTWDLSVDLMVTIPLPIAGGYVYDYEYQYEPQVSSGTIALDWDIDLLS
jgi:hypothetical protein